MKRPIYFLTSRSARFRVGGFGLSLHAVKHPAVISHAQPASAPEEREEEDRGHSEAWRGTRRLRLPTAITTGALVPHAPRRSVPESGFFLIH
jgi:hypothetical protein